MFRPGYASLPRPPEPQPPHGTQSQYGPPPSGPGYPVTTPFAAPAGDTPPIYGQPYPGDPAGYPPTGYATSGYGPPGYGAPPSGPPPRRRSNVPLVALILAVTVLLCGGGVTAGVMVARVVADRAKEAVKPITEPTLPQLPTEAPDLPGLPTDIPTLPTDLPALPGATQRTITVTYEVTGDGPAEIGYVEKPGDTPKRISDAKLPWKLTTTMQSPAFVLVTAIRGDTGDGSISCRATVDGEEVAQSSRDGAFATVACSKFVLE
jgi:Mycobacterium membrane protein